MATQPHASETPLIQGAGERLARRLHVPLPGHWLDRLLMTDRLQALYGEAVKHAGHGPLFGGVLEALGVRVECAAEDLARIPRRGATVVVANHPFGMLEGPVLGDLLLRVRPDVRILANSMLTAIPGLREYVFPVDVFGGGAAARANRAPLRQALQWLQDGGLLVVFPAGEVSSLRWKRLRVEDPLWRDAAARLIERSDAVAVPMYIHGTNGAGFQTAGLVHPRLRTALLGRELLNKRGRPVRVSIGAPVAAARLKQCRGDGQATDYLRRRSYALGWRDAGGHAPAVRTRREETVAAAVDRGALRAEIEALPVSQRLLSSGGFDVILARAQQIPVALREIGRLRELTFRQAGEGTGRALDLDRFDNWYEHLLLWHAEKGAIAGAYRLVETEQALSARGLNGLYTAGLFHFTRDLFRRLGPALELGRSFVCPDYQRQPLSLLLLWKGIGQVAASRPQCRHLFGPVSISADYGQVSRDLMVSFLRQRFQDPALSDLVRPRRAPKARPLLAAEIQALGGLLAGADELGQVVADLEPGGRSIPVLLRQYLNVGGRFLSFSVDKQFSSVVDALVLVDLCRTEPKLLRRYLGETGSAAFLTYHRLAHDRSAA